MCHEYLNRAWNRELEEIDEIESESEVRELADGENPSFLTDEEVSDAEILTDGGDEES